MNKEPRAHGPNPLTTHKFVEDFKSAAAQTYLDRQAQKLSDEIDSELIETILALSNKKANGKERI